MRKDFFRIPQSSARIVILLTSILLIGLGISVFLTLIPKQESDTTEADKQLIEQFLASVKKRENEWKNKYAKTFHLKSGKTIRLVPFDPNTVDSITLVNMGLRPYIAKNILKYRTKGGKFQTPESFSKIYGISSDQFNQLLPFIYIGDEFQKQRMDTIRFERAKKDSFIPFKYAEGTIVDLNRADTTELKKIPQIGTGLAKMIIGYREKLGGFHSVRQLSEIEYLPQGIEKWFAIHSPLYRKIKVNKASLSKLRNHPYLNFYQAKVILEHRRRFGKIKSLSEISLYTEFTRKDFERISPYLDFD